MTTTRPERNGAQAQPSNPDRIRGARVWLYALGGALLYFLMAAYYVNNGEVNADEGFYAYASHSAMHGQVPYRDFAYSQMPALPYLQGPFLALTGYGVRQQRWLNAGLGTVAVFVAVTLYQTAGLTLLATLTLVLVWSLTPWLVYHDTIGKTYAMTQLLLVAAGSLLISNWAPRRKLAWLSLFSVLAVGCRLTVAPAVVVLWCGLVHAEGRRLSPTLMLGVPVLIALLLIGPFFAGSENALFWSWNYHLQSLVPASRLKLLGQSFAAFPAVSVLVLGTLALMLTRRVGAGSPAGWIFWAGITGWISSVGLTGVYVDYAVPVIPLLLLGIGALIAAARLNPRQLLPGAALAAGALAFGFMQGEHFLVPGYLDSVDETVAYLRQRSAPTDTILSPMPEIPLEAGRPVFPGMEMGKFALTAEMDEATARRRHIVTADRLWLAIDRQEAPIIVLSNFLTWNFHWTIPSLRPARPEHYQQWVDLLLARYDCVKITRNFIIFKVHDPANARVPINLNP